jgi:hypothetical protein
LRYKVGDFTQVIGSQHQVAGLDIAMNDVAVVRE